MHRHSTRSIGFTWVAAIAMGFIALAAFAAPEPGTADLPSDHQQHPPKKEATVDASLPQQIADLRAQIERLQAALDQGHNTQSAAEPAGQMNRNRMNPMADSKMQGMKRMGASQGSGGMPGMGMKKDMDGMGAMGGMRGGGMKMMGMMGGMDTGAAAATPSALPGFPGASHLYHIGATGFYLDHPDHITLTVQQQTALNQAREQAALEQATFDRNIAEAEQQLWVLTAADEPDAAKIQAKVREIEKLRGDQRIAFIRAVGRAATVLTDAQRDVLVGAEEPVPAASKPATKKIHQHTP